MNLLRWPNAIARWMGYKPTESSIGFDLLIFLLGWILLIGATWFLFRRLRPQMSN